MSKYLDDPYTSLTHNNNIKKSDLVYILSRIQTESHPTENCSQWNKRLRESINVCFNKIGLRPRQRELFGIWYENVSELSQNATIYDIFNCAPEDCLYVLGL